MQVGRKLDHTEVRLRLTRDWRDPIRFVGQVIGALGLLLLLGWPLVGVGVIVLGALLYAGMTRWQHLLHSP